MDFSEFWNNFVVWFESEGAIKLTSLTLVLIVGFVAIKIILAFVKKAFKKTRLDNTVGDFLLQIIKFCLYLIWAMAMVSSLGVSLTGFTVIATALSLGVSLALENLLSNLVNGFVLISGKLFKEGDYIELDDKEGEVKGIHILYTRLLTADNKQVSIPNSQVMTKPIVNHSAESLRRLDVEFTIANHENVEKTKDIFKKVALESKLTEPIKPPFVAVSQVNELGAKLLCRVWTKNENYWDTKYYLIDKIFESLKKNNIALAKQNLSVTLLSKNPKPILNTKYNKK